jgi:D-hydroxyproline dehydrogenase subunit beta
MNLIKITVNKSLRKQMQDFDLVVVGAGIIGASVCWHATQKGLRVAVIDSIGPAAAASGASDGAVSVASKRPGLVSDLAYESLAYTETLAQKGGPLYGVFHKRPSYFFASNEQEDAALDQLKIKLASLGDGVRVVADGRCADGILTGLGQSVNRIVKLEGEGHMLGYFATQAYLDSAKPTFFWRESVTAIDENDDGVLVHCQSQKIRARAVVCAMGVMSGQFFGQLPVVPRAGQLIVTDVVAQGQPVLDGALTAGAYLISKTDANVVPDALPIVIDPLTTGQFLIGSSRESHGRSDLTDLNAIQSLLRRAVDIYPVLRHQRVIRTFTGVRAAVKDGLPILGLMPQKKRTWMATGFEGDGICLSAWIGRTVCEGLAGAHDARLLAISPSRFGLSVGST